jgi:hypothetical protein
MWPEIQRSCHLGCEVNSFVMRMQCVVSTHQWSDKSVIEATFARETRKRQKQESLAPKFGQRPKRKKRQARRAALRRLSPAVLISFSCYSWLAQLKLALETQLSALGPRREGVDILGRRLGA